MDKVNPKYVFRNYLAQQAIDGLETDDPSVLDRLMRVLERPYDEQPEHEDLAAGQVEVAGNLLFKAVRCDVSYILAPGPGKRNASLRIFAAIRQSASVP